MVPQSDATHRENAHRLWRGLADLLIHYSLRVRPGQRVLVVGPAVAEPLLRELLRTIQQAGAEASIVKDAEEWSEADACLFVESSELAPLLPQRREGETKQTLLQHISERSLPWSATLYPTEADAARAGMSFPQWQELFVAACFLDQPDSVLCWQRQSERQALLCDRLRDKKELRVRCSGGTDLKVAIAGQSWVNSAGRCNLPDGEVYTSPVEGTAEGVVRIPGRIRLGRQEMQDISLELANGQVIAARAKQGQELLERILSIDAGARRLGEVALGCNFRVTQLTGHPLVDEKMGGAFHLALGASLPGTGGCNISAVHWDLVLDLRRGGRVDVDGERCIEDGRFLPAW